jgi:hypothetical protein
MSAVTGPSIFLIEPLLSYLHVVQVMEGGIGHTPVTSSSTNALNISDTQIAAAFVSSQGFANVNNGGMAVDPNAPASPNVVDSLFQTTLGHLPSPATLAGFADLTNAEAFLDFALSPTVTSIVGIDVNS